MDYVRSGPLFDNEDPAENLVLTSEMYEYPVSMNSDHTSAVCPNDSVLAGTYNEGGTKNMSDIDRLRCMRIHLQDSRGRYLGVEQKTTTQVPIAFGGTGGAADTNCPAGMWASGFMRGSNNNPNNGYLLCKSIGITGDVGNRELVIPSGEPRDSLSIVPSPPNPAGTRVFTGFRNGSKQWAYCGDGLAMYALKTLDKGTNLYDINEFRCTPRLSAQGPLEAQYANLLARTVPDQIAQCCDADDYPTNTRSPHRTACGILGHSDSMETGSCVDMGLGEYCQSEDVDTGFPMLTSDPICAKWCNRYPTSCDAARVAWCDKHPDSSWCACLKASTRQDYKKMIAGWNVLQTVPNSCWWMPCKEESSLVLATAETRAQRTQCPDVISQSIYIDGDGNYVDGNFDIIQNIQNVNIPPEWFEAHRRDDLRRIRRCFRT